MTKSELIAALAGRYPQLALRDTDLAVKTVLDAMTQALAGGQRIEIRGFGSFSLSARSPRVGRNPKSGEKVMVDGLIKVGMGAKKVTPVPWQGDAKAPAAPTAPAAEKAPAAQPEPAADAKPAAAQ